MNSQIPHRSVIVVAGGKGLRTGSDLPKQFCEIGGKPMLMHTIEAFYRYDSRMLIVLVLPADYVEFWEKLTLEHRFNIPVTVVVGGETRFHSVKNGLAAIPDDALVGIHDAARPFVSQAIIERCYSTADRAHCGAIPVVAPKDTMRIVSKDGESKLIDRERIRVIQTPQVFPARLLKVAYQADYDNTFTDDASVAENAGIGIRLVDGEEHNIKITTPFDMQIARLFMSPSNKT